MCLFRLRGSCYRGKYEYQIKAKQEGAGVGITYLLGGSIASRIK